MAAGDPYCITHGFNYCVCKEAHKNGYWVGDNQPDYDLLYRPNPDANKQYYYQPVNPEPYVDTTEVTYTTYTTDWIAHDRWSRMWMCIEEAWEFLPGFVVHTPITVSTQHSYSNNYQSC